MKQKKDNTQKCEFVLTLGNNIVCQRFFSVRNFNNKAPYSLDLHYVMTDVVNGIKDKLKQKTLFLLDSNFRENPNQNNVDDADFTITIKKGNKVIYTRILPADVYPPKVRYTVDIRPQISYILRELTETLSTRKLITNYQDYSLIVGE
tara:strand:- start:905 stop:1348 length:444 start_codon:yes stop_codon:yes gene_type:complete